MNKVIAREYVEKNYIHKDIIRKNVIRIKNTPVKDMFITMTQAKLNTIIELEKLLEEKNGGNVG